MKLSCSKASAPARYIALPLSDRHGLVLGEVTHQDRAVANQRERAVARVLGQPLGSADGRHAVPAAGAEAPFDFAPRAARAVRRRVWPSLAAREAPRQAEV